MNGLLVKGLVMIHILIQEDESLWIGSLGHARGSGWIIDVV